MACPAPVDDIGCFSSFIAETRSSQSLTAQLKDLALGSFAVCGIDVDKSGPQLSKVGDDTDYSITITNTGRATLYKQSIIDSLGRRPHDATCDTSDCGASLAPEASCTITYTLHRPTGDPDPLVNTVDIVYTEFANPLSLSFTDSAEWEVATFTPSVDLTKAADREISKAGDTVGYTVTVTNTSSANTPDLTCTVTDAVAGIDETVTLGSGDPAVEFTGSATLPTGDGTFPNTASVSCDIAGFTNTVGDSASDSVTYFTPSVDLTKAADREISKAGDTVGYTVTVTNTSSANTPDLTCTVTDAVAGIDETVTLGSGDPAVEFTGSATLPTGDGTFPNTASVSCDIAGFTNTVGDSASDSVTYFTPSVDLTKAADREISKAGDTVGYTVTVTNTSSANTPDLTCTVTDAVAGIDETVTLGSGDPAVEFTGSATLPTGDGTFPNTASVSCDIAGFTNTVGDSASDSVTYFTPSVDLTKAADREISKAGDTVGYTVTVTNTSSANTPDLTCTVTDAVAGIDETVTLGSGDPAVEFTGSATLPTGDGTFPNTASVSCDIAGFTNTVGDSASDSVTYFTPSVDLTKAADREISKAGDTVGYTVTVTNTSSANTPDLTCTVTDAVAGIDETVTLGSGDPAVEFTGSATLPTGDGTFPNTASVSCDIAGFTNTVGDSASDSVTYFTPSVDLTKAADREISKAGDTVGYTVTVTNTSSANTPDLTCTVTDAVAGIDETVTLGSGDPAVEFTGSATLPTGDGTFPNTASVSCDIAGFTNTVGDSASDSVTYFTPSISLVKTGDAYSKVGDAAEYTVTITNTSSANTPALSLSSFVDTLVPGVTPPAACDVLTADGDSCQFSYAHTVVAGDTDPLENTATATYAIAGFTEHGHGQRRSFRRPGGPWLRDLQGVHQRFGAAGGAGDLGRHVDQHGRRRPDRRCR